MGESREGRRPLFNSHSSHELHPTKCSRYTSLPSQATQLTLAFQPPSFAPVPLTFLWGMTCGMYCRSSWARFLSLSSSWKSTLGLRSLTKRGTDSETPEKRPGTVNSWGWDRGETHNDFKSDLRCTHLSHESLLRALPSMSSSLSWHHRRGAPLGGI